MVRVALPSSRSVCPSLLSLLPTQSSQSSPPPSLSLSSLPPILLLLHYHSISSLSLLKSGSKTPNNKEIPLGSAGHSLILLSSSLSLPSTSSTPLSLSFYLSYSSLSLSFYLSYSSLSLFLSTSPTPLSPFFSFYLPSTSSSLFSSLKSRKSRERERECDRNSLSPILLFRKSHSLSFFLCKAQ